MSFEEYFCMYYKITLKDTVHYIIQAFFLLLFAKSELKNLRFYTIYELTS